jgi:hypothetical protein
MNKHYSNHDNIYADDEIYRNFKKHHQIPASQIMKQQQKPSYDNATSPTPTSTTFNNRYSYNHREEPLNIKVQLNKNSSKDLYTDHYTNRDLPQNEYIGDSRKSSLTYMDNTYQLQIDSANTTQQQQQQKLKPNERTKNNVIMVRPAPDSIEDLNEVTKTSKTKKSERKSISFKESDIEKPSNNTKRSSSVNINKNEIDRKRLFKNQTALAHQSDSSESSDDDDGIINVKGKMVDIEEDEEEGDDNMKIFPSEINKKKFVQDKNQNLKFQEMLKSLKGKANTMDFIMKKAPQNATVKTRIRRIKRKLMTQYTMFLELPDGNEIALMQTKRKRASTRVYVSINALELVDKQSDEYSELERYLQIPCGKLKSKSKLKVIYDSFILTNNMKKSSSIVKGLNFLSKKTKKIQNDPDSGTSNGNGVDDCEVYREFLRVDYENSIYKISQPLKFSVSLMQQQKGSNKLVEYDKLITKGPKFDMEKNKYILDFNSRVEMASVNNFQVILANPDFQDTIILQAGKSKSNEYICDFAYPLSAFEAFGIVLTAMNRKFV